MLNDFKKNYIFVVGLFAFIIYQAVNFFYFPLHTIFPDENRFILRAILFAQTDTFGANGGTAWEMPLTSVFLGYIYKILGSEESLIVFTRVFQSLLLILQAFLIYKISMKIFKNKTVALLTYTVVLFYPYFVYYQALVLSETLFNTALIVSFYYIYRWYESDFMINRYFILSNLFLILSIYIKATLSLLAPLLLAGFYFFNKFNVKDTMKILLFSSLIYALFLSPWWIRNYYLFNTFVPFTTTSAWNLYLGNNPHNLSGGCDWSKDVDPDVVKKITQIENEVERNRAFKEEAIKFIKENPKRFIELAFLKFKRFYAIVPNASKFNEGIYKWISILSYGPVFIFFIIGIFWYRKKFKELSAIYILILYFTLIHMVVIASLRYRLPLEPFMILLSMPVLVDIFYKSKSLILRKR